MHASSPSRRFRNLVQETCTPFPTRNNYPTNVWCSSTTKRCRNREASSSSVAFSHCLWSLRWAPFFCHDSMSSTKKAALGSTFAPSSSGCQTAVSSVLSLGGPGFGAVRGQCQSLRASNSRAWCWMVFRGDFGTPVGTAGPVVALTKALQMRRAAGDALQVLGGYLCHHVGLFLFGNLPSVIGSTWVWIRYLTRCNSSYEWRDALHDWEQPLERPGRNIVRL